MAQKVCIILDTPNKARLEQIAIDRSRPFKHVQRARIILFSGDRLPAADVARRAGSASSHRPR